MQHPRSALSSLRQMVQLAPLARAVPSLTGLFHHAFPALPIRTAAVTLAVPPAPTAPLLDLLLVPQWQPSVFVLLASVLPTQGLGVCLAQQGPSRQLLAMLPAQYALAQRGEGEATTVQEHSTAHECGQVCGSVLTRAKSC